MEFYSRYFPKARKEHVCEMCGETIPAGETYCREVGKFEGDFFCRKLHEKCFFALDEYLRQSDDGEFSYYGIADWWADKKCGTCKHRHRPCRHEGPYEDGIICPNRTDDGYCGAEILCDLQHPLQNQPRQGLRLCWCERYEMREEDKTA